MTQLSGWVAGWTDGGEISILSAWTLDDEAKAACQQDVRDGEDMNLGPDAIDCLKGDRFTLRWETSEQISGFTADCDNGQGTYFVHKV